MKKIVVIGLILSYLFEYNVSFANAQNLNNSYSTAEDVLLELLRPDIERLLKDKNGEIFKWDYIERGGLVDLKYVHDLSTPKWFDLTLSVEYKMFKAESTKPKIGKSLIRIKIIPSSFSRNENTPDKIEIIDFQDAQRLE
jgi:hypothetical protein